MLERSKLRLRPAPFGMSWRLERHGDIYVVIDDREVAGYGLDGVRVWKSAGRGKLAFATARVSIAPGPDGIDLLETDLAIGSFERRLSVRGTMAYVGAHASVAGDAVVFVTDERVLYAVDTNRWEVAAQHTFDAATHLLPPVVTKNAVFVAAVERARTQVHAFDLDTFALGAVHEVRGRAYALSTGSAGLVVDTASGLGRSAERTVFRPEQPAVKLVSLRHPPPVRVLPSATSAYVIERRARLDGRHDTIFPVGPGRLGRDRSGFELLAAFMDAESVVLERVGAVDPMLFAAVGLVPREPRFRWRASTGRDPCLVSLFETRSGDSICAYWYPPAKDRRVPVVLVRSDERVEWLTSDFDRWIAGVVLGAPEAAARALTSELGVEGAPLEREIPPAWFAEAHVVPYSVADANRALAAGDFEGAERMLVSARAGRAQLAEVYERLGWLHHRAVVLETW